MKQVHLHFSIIWFWQYKIWERPSAKDGSISCRYKESTQRIGSSHSYTHPLKSNKHSPTHTCLHTSAHIILTSQWCTMMHKQPEGEIFSSDKTLSSSSILQLTLKLSVVIPLDASTEVKKPLMGFLLKLQSQSRQLLHNVLHKVFLSGQLCLNHHQSKGTEL